LMADEYLVSDLIGLQCHFDNDRSSPPFGVVVSAIPPSDMFSGAFVYLMHSMLEIRKLRSKECVLIPFVPAIVPLVDLELRRVYIDPPKGLLDMSYLPTDRVVIRGYLPSRSAVLTEEARTRLQRQCLLQHPLGGIRCPVV
jgi:hypothetical protein